MPDHYRGGNSDDTRSSTSGSGSPDGAGEEIDSELDLRSDPRVRTEHVRVRHLDAAGTRVVLVGVVHDHPASRYRAAAIVEDVSPDVVALELPDLAIPLFEQFAADPGQSDPGGEMSAAIEAAGDAAVTGIDVPSTSFVRSLIETLGAIGPSATEIAAVASRTASVTGHALRCRLAASPAPVAIGGPPVEAIEYDCDRTDPPVDQADHEASRLRQSRSLLGALDYPIARRVTDEARERAMACRLSTIGQTGDVVAVVGFGHLDEIADALSAREKGSTSRDGFSAT